MYFAVLLISFTLAAQAQVTEILPVLVPASGFYLRPYNGEPLINLEFFLDLNCKDSKDIWEPMLELNRHYSPSKLATRVYMYPLPYHRNAMICSQGLIFLRENMPEKMQDYITMVFEHMRDFSSKMTSNQTDVEVLEHLVQLMSELTGLPTNSLGEEIHKYNGKMRREWKLGASRGVAGTPTVFVNGIKVFFTDPGLDGFKELIDRLLDESFPSEQESVDSERGSTTEGVSSSSSTSIYKFW